MATTADPQGGIGQRVEQALALHKQGALGQARPLYEAVLRQVPGHADALRYMGMMAVQTGDASAAVEFLNRSIQANPANAATRSNLGVALRALDRHEDAQASFRAALELESDNPVDHFNLGITLKELGRAEEALASYDAAIALTPAIGTYHAHRGVALAALGRLEEAVANLQAAIARDPADAAAHCELGIVWARMQRNVEALACFDAAIACDNTAGPAHFNRATVLAVLGRGAEALASADAAIACDPNAADAHAVRGSLLTEANRLEEALARLARALEIDRDCEFVFGDFFHTRRQLCDWSGEEALRRELIDRIEAGRKAVSPFAGLVAVDSPAIQLLIAEQWLGARFPAPAAAPGVPARARDGKIRIGYFSADFYAHAVSYLLAGVIETHDRAAFEVIGFAFGPPRADAMRARLAAGFDRFIDVSAMADADVARLARDMGIDIAVDLGGYTDHHRTGIFAARAAGVQVNYLGYPAGMGAPFIDYILADRTVIPPESARHYRERIAYLPHTYQPNDRKRQISLRPVTRAEQGLPDAGFVFCGFNNVAKIAPEMFGCWMRILRAVPGSVLWLSAAHPAAVANLRRAMVDAGIAADRLVFATRLPTDEHLARHRLADLFIDTRPYNAHTTASDALWAGVPLLTCMGEGFASRVAASLLHAIGLPELITESLDGYEALAIALAGDPARLGAIRKKLADNQQTQPLFDTALYTRHIEAAFTAMHDRHCRGLPPEMIAIAP